MNKQDSQFWQSEADAWFKRSGTALENRERLKGDPILRMIETLNVNPQNVVEVGASNGYRLDALRAKFNAQTVAIEPSTLAIENGQRLFPHVKFVRGLASEMPLPDETADLVIVAGVFYVIGRSSLLQSVAEIDRILQNDGLLIISDFLPSCPQKVFYHHLPGEDLWSYKQDYSALFLASCLYEPVAMLTFDFHDSSWGTGRAGNRFCVSCLRKNVSGIYQATTREGDSLGE